MPIDKLHSKYMALVSNGHIQVDKSQLELIELLDALLVTVDQKRLARKSSALGWLFGKNIQSETKGLYIWGDVGRGKSMLMDMFFESLPHTRKRRAHFNDFMQDAHERIHAHREAFKRGEVTAQDPIPKIARELASEAIILCFDEFTVTDIADAMILGRLFEVMFAEGVIVVATSNVEPKNLYTHGLNRNLFLPFIDLLVQRVTIFRLEAPTDYRLEKLNQAPVYLSPIDAQASKVFHETWMRLAGAEKGNEIVLELKGREFIVPEAANGVAKLSFDILCKQPRSASDYLALAYRFHTIFIENIPVMNKEDQNAAKRFILLIDTLYDNHIRIVVTADAKPDELYTVRSGTEAFEFKRTVSRLHEMQSHEYMGKRG